ncbi:MAG TPA: hypothetical protein VN493_24710 [Thermoanaerobaculia bacterium]|nr:hypothetical protein [Thermoanaerobaculia bacterium]
MGSFKDLGTLAYEPLKPEQRLFYGLAGLGLESPLEVRYFVKDKPYLTEVVDLANAQLPKSNPGNPKSLLKSGTGLDLESLLAEERRIELLALRPDLVRQLHQLARKEKAPIRIELHQDGRLFESLSFVELIKRTAELRERPVVPLVVLSTVSGPGDRGEEKIRSVVASTYLESCSECTTSTPCETECGWDPGKGGPVTCGEYGICDYNPTCSCSSVISEYWTGWYFLGAYYANQFACYRSFTVTPPAGAWHQRYVEEYRRDRIRRTYVCPNCPSCDNCYYQETVIAYEIGIASCWQEGVQLCSNASTPCCSSLCFAGPFTPCHSWC